MDPDGSSSDSTAKTRSSGGIRMCVPAFQTSCGKLFLSI